MGLARRQAIRAQLDLGHPVTGAYNANNALAADEMNALNLSAPGGFSEVIKYISENRTRSNQGNDTVATAIIGRLEKLAQASVNDDPFGRLEGFATQEQIHAAGFLLRVFTSPNILELDWKNSEIDFALQALGGGTGARVFKPADITAIQAFSENKTSVSLREGFGNVQEGDIEAARALP